MGALQLLDYAEFVQQFFKRALVLVALEQRVQCTTFICEHVFEELAEQSNRVREPI